MTLVSYGEYLNAYFQYKPHKKISAYELKFCIDSVSGKSSS